MIGIDTNILIWGLDQTCSPGLERMIVLAKTLFDHAAKERLTIVIPAQALAEFLVRNTAEEMEEALTKIDESFPIAPLDNEAATASPCHLVTLSPCHLVTHSCPAWFFIFPKTACKFHAL